eukprot:TRINITY_DN3747_c0_g2_i4.p1 TRINITY_DN3747_c0_g2~~TRINITY_DN3747_c0_g2_i4.p1  ORF type:complete len:148 (-),score=4.64 TRINITY_DN3747_c0_g2_i4:1219-1662(-)
MHNQVDIVHVVDVGVHLLNDRICLRNMMESILVEVFVIWCKRPSSQEQFGELPFLNKDCQVDNCPKQAFLCLHFFHISPCGYRICWNVFQDQYPPCLAGLIQCYNWPMSQRHACPPCVLESLHPRDFLGVRMLAQIINVAPILVTMV